jgi:hypothetical protein
VLVEDTDEHEDVPAIRDAAEQEDRHRVGSGKWLRPVITPDEPDKVIEILKRRGVSG